MTKVKTTTNIRFFPKIVEKMLTEKIECPVCHNRFERWMLNRFHLPFHYDWNGKIKNL